MRYYYKRVESIGTIYESRTFPSAFGEEISEEEYNDAITQLEAEIETENAEITKKRENRILELEKENAALLYELLTGEAFVE